MVLLSHNTFFAPGIILIIQVSANEQMVVIMPINTNLPKAPIQSPAPSGTLSDCPDIKAVSYSFLYIRSRKDGASRVKSQACLNYAEAQPVLCEQSVPLGRALAVFDCKGTNICESLQIFRHILAFCFSPAPEPRYFERASLNFQVRSSTKVRRAGLRVVSSRIP